MADKLQHFAEMYHAELIKSDCGKEIICVDGIAERGAVQGNGRSPDIVAAYAFNTGIIVAAEACPGKSDEIVAVPLLIDKIDVFRKAATADAMSMQRDIIDTIRGQGGFPYRTQGKPAFAALHCGGQDQGACAAVFIYRRSGTRSWRNRDNRHTAGYSADQAG